MLSFETGAHILARVMAGEAVWAGGDVGTGGLIQRNRSSARDISSRRRRRAHTSVSTTPPAAPTSTTAQAGARNAVSSTNPSRDSTNGPGPVTAVVNTGV